MDDITNEIADIFDELANPKVDLSKPDEYSREPGESDEQYESGGNNPRVCTKGANTDHLFAQFDYEDMLRKVSEYPVECRKDMIREWRKRHHFRD